MILHRALQVVGGLALVMCAHLAWGATGWGGGEFSRARLLYAAAGAVPALVLIAVGGLGLALRRAEQRAAEMAAALARIEAELRARRG